MRLASRLGVLVGQMWGSTDLSCLRLLMWEGTGVREMRVGALCF